MHIHPAQFQPSLNPLTSQPISLDEETLEVLGIVGVLLAVMGVTQLVFSGGLSPPASLGTSQSKSGGAGSKGSKARLGEEIHTTITAQSSHLNLAFIHVCGAGALVAWIYLFHSSRNFLSTSSSLSSPKTQAGSLAAVLGNQVVFSAALMDMLFWGYLWTVIREERREVLTKVQGMRAEEEDDN